MVGDEGFGVWKRRGDGANTPPLRLERL